MDQDGGETYGKRLYEMRFDQALNEDLLTDYKVIIFAMPLDIVSAHANQIMADDSLELNLDDATKIIGCYKALNKEITDGDEKINTSEPPMKRAMIFTNTISNSKEAENHFEKVVDSFHESVNDPSPSENFAVEVRHVDGTFDSKEREQRIQWLNDVPQEKKEHVCRVLSNVFCLSEGVDIPDLDAVIFLHPKKSMVQVVQSVGRVMRKAEGKKMGYVILPIGVPSNVEDCKALDKNKGFDVVWQVLNALRSHDKSLEVSIEQLQLGQETSDRIIFGHGFAGLREQGYNTKSNKDSLPSHAIDEIRRYLFTKTVDKCGTRGYWSNWAKDIGIIAQRHIERIKGLINPELHPKNREIFNRFLKDVRDDLNDSVTEELAVEMLAQHIITRPIFQVLFAERQFVEKNPISQAMGSVLGMLDQNGIEKESIELSSFYKEVRRRFQGLTDAAAKQKFMIKLYEEFFRSAFSKKAKQLGIFYTPIEIVDFIIHSVNELLQNEFEGKTLGSQGVHILDPYAGTGSFISRLLESGLMTPQEIKRKYLGTSKHGVEIHANELMLLSYYIAAINIETAYQEIMAEHETKNLDESSPFPGICLTDTFGLHEKDDEHSEFFHENSKRRMNQKSQKMRVIIGNPPYSVGQKSANDNLANTKYERLDQRIESTYVKNSINTNKNSLYNSYIKAIRLGSDQINKAGGGILAFVTDAGWITSSTGSGLRHCVEQEFSKIYVFYLRGAARKKGGGANVFDCCVPIAISFFIQDGKEKNQNSAEIFFYDIGKHKKKKQKLDRIAYLKSLGGITAMGSKGWRKIQPDEHSDWLNHRDPRFSQLLALGDKKEKNELLVFDNYSRGIQTARDAWCYNPSRSQVLSNMKRMITCYNKEVERLHSELDSPSVAEIKQHADSTDSRIKWTRALYKSAQLGRTYCFNQKNTALSSYRPFTKRWLYYDRSFNEMVYQIPKIFPLDPESPQGIRENEVIVVSGLGSTAEWSCLITNALPNLDIIQKSQCFPRYLYDPETSKRREAITDEALEHFQKKCKNSSITKEQIFYYIYGVFHSEKYRSRFAVNLKKELARVPVVGSYKEFRVFSKKGYELAQLHLGYDKAHSKLEEWCPGVEVEEKSIEKKESDPKAYYRVIKMKLGRKGKEKDPSQIIYNAYINIKNIPEEAWDYKVNGRSALKWILGYQLIKEDKASGITKDPNAYGLESGDSKYLLNLLLGVIAVSVRTGQLVKELPELRWSEEKLQTEIIQQSKEELSVA